MRGQFFSSDTLNFHCMLLKKLTSHMEYVVSVQTPLLLMKATSVAVRHGCVFTHILLWRQHLWLYVVGVHSPVLCCEGNIHGRTSWVCIYPYFHESNRLIEYSLQPCAVKPGTMSMCKYCNRVTTSVAVHCGCAFTHTFMKAIDL